MLADPATKFTCRDRPNTGTGTDSFDGAANMSGVYSSSGTYESSSPKSHPYLVLCTCSESGDQ